MTLGYLMYTSAPSRELSACSRMGENILFGPACKIKRGAGGEEFEAGRGHFRPALAGKAFFKFRFQPMQVKHVRCCIFELRLA